LIPDIVIPMNELDPLPVADADRRDFATIIAAAQDASGRCQSKILNTWSGH